MRWVGGVGMLASLAGVLLVAQPPFLTGGAEWSNQHLIGGRFSMRQMPAMLQRTACP